MYAENNKLPIDALDLATAAVRGAGPSGDRPPPAVVAATLAALAALETTAPADERMVQMPRAAPASRFRRTALWAAALAAALLIGFIVTRPSKPPDLMPSEQRHLSEIAIIEVNPADEFARMDERLAQAQNEVTA